MLTIIGLQFSFLLAGAIIIENVFFLPGVGRLTALADVAKLDRAPRADDLGFHLGPRINAGGRIGRKPYALSGAVVNRS